MEVCRYNSFQNNGWGETVIPPCLTPWPDQPINKVTGPIQWLIRCASPVLEPTKHQVFVPTFFFIPFFYRLHAYAYICIVCIHFKLSYIQYIRENHFHFRWHDVALLLVVAGGGLKRKNSDMHMYVCTSMCMHRTSGIHTTYVTIIQRTPGHQYYYHYCCKMGKQSLSILERQAGPFFFFPQSKKNWLSRILSKARQSYFFPFGLRMYCTCTCTCTYIMIVKRWQPNS